VCVCTLIRWPGIQVYCVCVCVCTVIRWSGTHTHTWPRTKRVLCLYCYTMIRHTYTHRISHKACVVFVLLYGYQAHLHTQDLAQSVCCVCTVIRWSGTHTHTGPRTKRVLCLYCYTIFRHTYTHRISHKACVYLYCYTTTRHTHTNTTTRHTHTGPCTDCLGPSLTTAACTTKCVHACYILMTQTYTHETPHQVHTDRPSSDGLNARTFCSCVGEWRRSPKWVLELSITNVCSTQKTIECACSMTGQAGAGNGQNDTSRVRAGVLAQWLWVFWHNDYEYLSTMTADVLAQGQRMF